MPIERQFLTCRGQSRQKHFLEFETRFGRWLQIWSRPSKTEWKLYIWFGESDWKIISFSFSIELFSSPNNPKTDIIAILFRKSNYSLQPTSIPVAEDQSVEFFLFQPCTRILRVKNLWKVLLYLIWLDFLTSTSPHIQVNKLWSWYQLKILLLWKKIIWFF